MELHIFAAAIVGFQAQEQHWLLERQQEVNLDLQREAGRDESQATSMCGACRGRRFSKMLSLCLRQTPVPDKRPTLRSSLQPESRPRDVQLSSAT
jgi:hypothetical protein